MAADLERLRGAVAVCVRDGVDTALVTSIRAADDCLTQIDWQLRATRDADPVVAIGATDPIGTDASPPADSGGADLQVPRHEEETARWRK